MIASAYSSPTPGRETEPGRFVVWAVAEKAERTVKRQATRPRRTAFMLGANPVTKFPKLFTKEAVKLYQEIFV